MENVWIYNARTATELVLIGVALILVRRWPVRRGRAALSAGLLLAAVPPAAWWWWATQVSRNAWEPQGQEAQTIEALASAAQVAALFCVCVFAGRVRTEFSPTRETSQVPQA